MASSPSDRNRRSGIRGEASIFEEGVQEESLTFRPGSRWVLLQENDVRGTLTVAFLHDFELNALSLAQRAVTARHGEHREVNEDIVHSCRQ
jgi:hypothetical protein